MHTEVKRIYVEKKKSFDIEVKHLHADIITVLGIEGLESVRILNRYDIYGITEETYTLARNSIFSEPPIDIVYDETLPLDGKVRVFAMEYLPGQYDQRADWAAQSIQILTQGEAPEVNTAKVIVLNGNLSDEQFSKIKDYCINPVDSREAALEKPSTLFKTMQVAADVEVIKGFIHQDDNELEVFMAEQGLAMSFADLKFCQAYFRDTEHRDPTITEIKVIDTYWSDHCRHTTFLTAIDKVEFEEGHYSKAIEDAFNSYLESRAYVYGNQERDICLMDIAVIAMKELRKRGQLDDLELSEEINACSIIVNVDVNGENEEWLVMFKNETHNHPTEIEPFGGAATCLGGAIRDPLSGRSYVYQAMRVTGSGDPRREISQTLPGKLPQRKITTGAAAGYSSYGNQIGLATGQVAEIYDEGYVAKRMEIGAVIAAAPRGNVLRKSPEAGDIIILLGGRTGRDGCGGATGSSKEHTEESIFTCGAEVQKGNPPTERKIQRLFRNPEVSQIIKKCNDFGAGGVSVAIGELAEGLKINLDAVPKKYDGLDGTELAISESQERMAVVIAPEHVERFKIFAEQENLEATVVASVTDNKRLQMFWRDQAIVDMSRAFLDSNGVKQHTEVVVTAPEEQNYFNCLPSQVKTALPDLKEAWRINLQDLNVTAQKGLVERFDSTIGAGTVLMPLGGKYQATPAQAMVAKIPVLDGDTNTGTVMSYGFNPELAKWSPFHGAVYAVIESIAKIVATGGNHHKVRLTLQEYFEKLGNDKKRWGKPFSALLGALHAQKMLGIAAIGGKDSMSGTFKELDVPPTLVSFAVAVVDVNKIISPEFKKPGSKVVYLPVLRNEKAMPDFSAVNNTFSVVHRLINEGKVISAHTVGMGGIAAAVSKMTFGNRIGFNFSNSIAIDELFKAELGGLILELDTEVDIAELNSLTYKVLGQTTSQSTINIGEYCLDIEEYFGYWSSPLAGIFPDKAQESANVPELPLYQGKPAKASVSIAKPRVLIPVFPGTNCEYDSAKAFENAGAQAHIFVFKNLNERQIEESILTLAKEIEKAQIIMLPGGFSAGDEPDGSGKFIATVFRNPRIKEAISRHLQQKDGLMLGICNGFQALVKLGLVPYGEIRDYSEESPTLTYNTIGRHISSLAQTKVISTLSPWLSKVNAGDIHTVAISHGEGRFVANEEILNKLLENGQVATQYYGTNPNGSALAIEGITSPDGRVFGKMGHSERIGSNLYKNVPGEKDQKIFEAGVEYFR